MQQLVLVRLGLCQEVLQLPHLLRVAHLALHEALRDHPLPLLGVRAVLLVPRDVELQQVDVLRDLAEESRVLRIGVVLLPLEEFQRQPLVLDEALLPRAGGAGRQGHAAPRGRHVRSARAAEGAVHRQPPGDPARGHGALLRALLRALAALLVRRRAHGSALAVPAQNEGDRVQRVLGDPVPAKLAVDQGVVRLDPFEQRLAAFRGQVVPAEVEVGDGAVFPEHLPEVPTAFRADLVVAQVHARDALVALQHVAKRLKPALVAAHVIPLEAEAQDAVGRAERMREDHEAVGTDAVAAQVDGLQHHIFAHVPRNRVAALIADGGVGERQLGGVFRRVEVCQEGGRRHGIWRLGCRARDGWGRGAGA
mmetsp:Transcript_55022/g.154772  ORF Transcript_55022/g.154772 Transcript_55022/m.154772 type:complete len:365 (-) Transcript_55022:25-1119(-)